MRCTALLTSLLLALLTGVAPAQSPREIRISMTEFAFQPAVLSLAVGRPVRLVFTNRGQIAHQFETGYLRALPLRVDDGRLLAEVNGLDALRLQPGGSARVLFTPRRAGRVPFACTIEGHQEAGMAGVLVVR